MTSQTINQPSRMARRSPYIPELMLAAHDWYAIGASFRGKTMGVRRPDAAMSPLDLAVMKHAFSQPGVATVRLCYKCCLG